MRNAEFELPQKTFPPGGIAANVAFHVLANEFVQLFSFQALFAGPFPQDLTFLASVNFSTRPELTFGRWRFAPRELVEEVDEEPVEVAARVETPL